MYIIYIYIYMFIRMYIEGISHGPFAVQYKPFSNQLKSTIHELVSTFIGANVLLALF